MTPLRLKAFRSQCTIVQMVLHDDLPQKGGTTPEKQKTYPGSVSSKNDISQNKLGLKQRPHSTGKVRTRKATDLDRSQKMLSSSGMFWHLTQKCVTKIAVTCGNSVLSEQDTALLRRISGLRFDLKRPLGARFLRC
jgi:hypothetical protein